MSAEMYYLCIEKLNYSCLKMNRRHFCKLASITIGVLGLSGLEANAAILSTRKIRSNEKLPVLPLGCRITVERCECYEDLQSLYLDDPEEGPCRAFRTGDTFNLPVSAECPKEFCPLAWKVLCGMIGEGNGCAATVRNGLKLLSCPDGSRPVLFKIELI